MATSVRTYKVEDLAQLEGDYELDRGRLVPVSSCGWDHGRVCTRFVRLLDEYAERTRQGEVVPDVGFVLERDPDTLRGPDVAFVRADRVPAMRGSGFPEAPPDLAVEVVGEGSSLPEAIQKAGQYLQAGCRLVWVAHNARHRVMEFRADGMTRTLEGDDRLEDGDMLPGFACKVFDIFSVLE